MRQFAFLIVVCSLAPAGLGIETGLSRTVEEAPGREQVIRIRSHLVSVPVSATDSNGQVVRDLTIDDFTVEENGEPVTIVKMGEPGETSLELALLFDISGSLHARFELERDAAAAFLRTILRPRDAVSIIAVGSQPRIIRHRTGSLAQALEGLQSVVPTGESTALFDSIAAAARLLGNPAQTEARHVLVVLSDGEDNRSERYRIDEAKLELQRADCLFYSVNPSGRSIRMNKISLRGQDGLETLARETGGAAFLVDRAEDLESIYSRIAEELQAQYLLGYYSPSPPRPGAFRTIRVRVPSRPDLRIRARQGYRAGRGGPAHQD